MNKCGLCNSQLQKKAHKNQKWCTACANELKRRPRGHMSEIQKEKARRLIGKMKREDIAKKLGVSLSNLKRSMPGESLWFHRRYKNQPELTKKVLNYYFKHGKSATEKRFPEVNVKAIVDRPEYYGVARQYRQKRWTEDQIIEAAKMAGLVSPAAQAIYFNRPRANAGSVHSLWHKRFKFGGRGSELNGMCHHQAKHFVSSRARYIRPIGVSQEGKPVIGRRLLLWVDMDKALKSDAPEFVREAVDVLAKFQKWLWNSDNPKPLIIKMIKERETTLK